MPGFEKVGRDQCSHEGSGQDAREGRPGPASEELLLREWPGSIQDS